MIASHLRKNVRVVVGKGLEHGSILKPSTNLIDRERERNAVPVDEREAISRNAHITFGNGPYVSLGQHIPCIEIDAVLVEVLSRMKEVERTAPHYGTKSVRLLQRTVAHDGCTAPRPA